MSRIWPQVHVSSGMASGQTGMGHPRRLLVVCVVLVATPPLLSHATRPLLVPPALAASQSAPATTPESTPPEDMVLVPGGEFTMGRDTPGADNSPAHIVRLAAFHLDRHEVTNAAFQRYCEATGAPLPEFWGMDRFRSGPGFPSHPVVGVSWREAMAFARWSGKRLPTEAEWEYAARGGLRGRPYPNGETIDPSLANYAAHGPSAGPVAVGQYPANGYGLFDMTGNVVEWVADYYAPETYASSPEEGPRGPEHGKLRVIRGGGWHSGPSCSRLDFRNALPQNWRDINVGFRCAKDVARPAGR